MNIIVDRPRARWLPSRRHYALGRLIATIRFHFAPEEPPKADREVYAIDRDKSALENCFIAAWMFVTITAYIASLLPIQYAIAAVPLSAIAIQLPIYLVGAPATPFRKSNRDLVSAASFGSVIAASVYFMRKPTAVRYVALFFLLVIALNAVAAVMMLFVREPTCDD